MSETSPTLGGVFAAVLTPLDAALAPDHAALARHCRWLLANGCDGLAVLGTTGEANAFSVDERLAILEGLAEAGIPTGALMGLIAAKGNTGKPFLVGNGLELTPKTDGFLFLNVNVPPGAKCSGKIRVRIPGYVAKP